MSSNAAQLGEPSFLQGTRLSHLSVSETGMQFMSESQVELLLSPFLVV